MIMSLRLRYTVVTSIVLLTIYLTGQYYNYTPSPKIRLSGHVEEPDINVPPQQPSTAVSTPSPISLPGPPFYKPSPTGAALQIVDNFPLAAAAHSAADLPPIPSWNLPPDPHVDVNTPLFIGFTRNWRLLQQVVVSYITSGWPAEDIYVVENTGVMDSNRLGLLSLQNPFFLNHTRLSMLGVKVLVTPTTLTFAQLQNFYLSTATQNSWAHYFWSHMDLVSVSLESEIRFPPSASTSRSIDTPPVVRRENELESPTPWENNTLYMNCVQNLRTVTSPDPSTGKAKNWASVFFSYDRLTLVNVAAHKSIGGWDTMIPFYMGDCDMHARIEMAGYAIYDAKAGLVYDVGSSLDDIAVLYRQKRGPHGDIPEPNFQDPKANEGEKEKREVVLEKRFAWGKSKEEIAREEAAKEVLLKEKDASARLEAARLASLFTPISPPLTDTHKPEPKQPKPDSALWKQDEPLSPTWQTLTTVLDRMQNSKNSGERNTWQARQSGGQGDPFYRDSAGFERGIRMTIEHGRAMFREKWGHRDCDIVAVGYRADDAWRVEQDWDR